MHTRKLFEIQTLANIPTLESSGQWVRDCEGAISFYPEAEWAAEERKAQGLKASRVKVSLFCVKGTWKQHTLV